MRWRCRLGGRIARFLFLCILGVLIGLSTTWCMMTAWRLPRTMACSPLLPARKGFVLMGIMTAAKYVDTRAYNVWRTWAQHVPGKVLFFVAEGTTSIHSDMPIIQLKGVDDSYPPQKKSFAMLKWMADNHLNDFEWFLRADDDLYIRGEELEKFLRGLDPSRPHAIGQAGLGNSAEYGLLALGATDNYCMGGPGIVLSRETLRRLADHLEWCLSHLLTSHEDVELGRCIRRFVGIACTWNYEMQRLFHNNHSTTMAYSIYLDETKSAITLHPIKHPNVMRTVHAHLRAQRLKEARARFVALDNELADTRPPSLIRSVPNSINDMNTWSFIDQNRIIFCANGVSCPRHTLDSSTRGEIGRVITQLFDQFNQNARQRGRVLQFQNLQYSYMRVDPLHGVDFVLDMILWFKKFRPPHRTTLSVRRHAYVQQTFASPQAIMDEQLRRLLYGEEAAISDHIHLVLPLKGRATVFSRFATHLKSICMRGKNISLVVALYASEDEADNRDTIRELSENMQVHVVEMGEEAFSRAIALTRASSILPSTALLFFTDVDMLFTCDALQRIRSNTIRGGQVYFPIVFSEFSPDSWSENDRLLADSFHYGRRRGYFRHFGFGLAALYKSDLEAIGGFNTDIAGWGLEDVDLFEKAIKQRHLRVVRAPEPGLVHIYHPIHCATDMAEAQRRMCHGSKAASLASKDSLTDQITHLA